MADGAKISSLTEATDAQMTDAGLIETAVADTGSSTGFSSKKSSFSRLAGYILNKFSGLSLAGSTQTVKSALDSLNSKIEWLTAPSSVTNLSTLQAWVDEIFGSGGKGYRFAYIGSSQSNAVGLPSGGHYLIFFSNSSNFREIKAFNSLSDKENIVQKVSGTWNAAWTALPTRAEVDALNSSLTNLSSGTILDYVKSQVAAGVSEGHFVATQNVSDIPASGTGWFVHYVRNIGSNIVQLTATQYNDSRVIYNTHIGNYQSSTSFAREWTQEPTASDIGSLSSLTTTAKTNLVAAINEVNAAINSLVDGNEVSY